MRALIRVGCSGFGMAQSKYFGLYSTIEIQQTFYQPPSIKTLNRWRNDAPDDFEFAMKAWQLITHSSKSPTLRRLKRQLSAQELSECGEFKNTDIVREALESTLACAEVLRSKAVIFQCPASFTPTSEHVYNLETFFTSFTRPKGVHLYWEPRGNWDPALIDRLCRTLHIFHAVDPFLDFSVTPDHPYFRLHGIGGWRHAYSATELADIDDRLQKPAQSSPHRTVPGYVFSTT